MNKRRVNLVVGLAIIIAIIVVVAIYKFQPFHLQSHISVSSDTYTVTDKTGKFVINPQFDNAASFSDGLARVEVGNKWGYIDKTGKFEINPQFDDAFGGHLIGYIPVQLNNNIQIDLVFLKKGIPILFPPGMNIKDIYPFSEGLAAVKVGNKWGYIHR